MMKEQILKTNQFQFGFVIFILKRIALVSDIQPYEMLSSKLGREEAKALVEFVESKADKKIDDKTTVFATKEDVARLEMKIAESKVDIMTWMFGIFTVLALKIEGLYFK